MTNFKFVAVLNWKIETWKVMNALAHATVWLTGNIEKKDDLWVINYEDKDSGEHFASKYPFIILKAKNSNQIRTLRNNLIEQSLNYASFNNCMTVWSYEEQLEKSKNTNEQDLEYFWIVTFWDSDKLNPLTKKFSLWN